MSDIHTSTHVDGTVERWDDGTSTYTRTDSGGVVLETRPYTQAETDRASMFATSARQSTNTDTIRTKLLAAIAGNQTDIADLTRYIDGLVTLTTAVTLKNLARTQRSILKQLNGLHRLMLNQTDDISDT